MSTRSTMTTEATASQHELLRRYRDVRSFSDKIVEPLEPEDCVVQSMPDVSPTRWHLAHTTWFFETFLLKDQPDYRTRDDRFEYLFNSYYNTVGQQFPRAKRGLLSRPTLAEVMAYRRSVDDAIEGLLDSRDPLPQPSLNVLELGLHHEQQHQELMLTDIKHVLSQNPLHPCYSEHATRTALPAAAAEWEDFDEGVYQIGKNDQGFGFDNESPQHHVFLHSFQLRNTAVTVGEYLQFMNDGGYQRPEFWLSLGWHHVQSESWQAPLYWQQINGVWSEFTLAGLLPLDATRPVCHVSYFEADAFARWSGAKLPTEAEWEVAAERGRQDGQFADALLNADWSDRDADKSADQTPLRGMFGDVWEWTASSYSPYPGYHPPAGAIGEYNGKFMCNQYVLRGGSCATPPGHIRPTYRNFFPAETRWQFNGIRLAR
jgi:ergothioneine biosynthesis protein EgtB